nr:MAG TPA: hypothetical protein [Caudoviricetes sp.]DAI91981.1 MAG TPA: hypothetical protein [Caudoviricetes sp.]
MAGLTEKILKANKDGQLHLLLISILSSEDKLYIILNCC